MSESRGNLALEATPRPPQVFAASHLTKAVAAAKYVNVINIDMSQMTRR